MQQAVDFTDVLIEHAKAAYEMASADPVVVSAKKVLRKIREEQVSQISTREIMRFDRTKGTKEAIEPTIHLLTDHNYLRRQKTPAKQGRPSELFDVNPAIWCS